MIRIQGKYRLTFPITPGKISVKGFGNDTETITSITLLSKNRATARRAKAISFEFTLPGNLEDPLIEVEGYQGPRAWLNGLDLLSGSEVLLTVDELDLAWNVLIGPCDGEFTGLNIDFRGNIEFPIFVKEDFITWSNNTQLLKPPQLNAKQRNARANTSGKTAKKQQTIVPSILQASQRQRIDDKITAFRADRNQ